MISVSPFLEKWRNKKSLKQRDKKFFSAIIVR